MTFEEILTELRAHYRASGNNKQALRAAIEEVLDDELTGVNSVLDMMSAVISHNVSVLQAPVMHVDAYASMLGNLEQLQQEIGDQILEHLLHEEEEADEPDDAPNALSNQVSMSMPTMSMIQPFNPPQHMRPKRTKHQKKKPEKVDKVDPNKPRRKFRFEED